MRNFIKNTFVSALAIMALPSFAQSDKVIFLSKTHCMMRAEVSSRYVLLPVCLLYTSDAADE